MAQNQWYQPQWTYLSNIIKMTFKNSVKVHCNFFHCKTDIIQPNLIGTSLLWMCLFHWKSSLITGYINEAHVARGPHFSNLRSDKISMLVKYDKTCINSSSFVNRVKVHLFLLRTPRIFLFTDVASNDDLEQVSVHHLL